MISGIDMLLRRLKVMILRYSNIIILYWLLVSSTNTSSIECTSSSTSTNTEWLNLTIILTLDGPTASEALGLTRDDS